MARLEATGKFKIISRDEAIQIAGNKAVYAKGFYDPKADTTYLVHDNIDKDTSDKALLGLMLHEIGVHALTLGKSNDAFKLLLKRFEAMKNGNPKVREAFDRVPEDTKAEHIVEEALAYFLENNPTATISQRIIEAFRQMIRAIGNTLVGKDKFLFSVWANKLTETELINMATSALRQAPDSLQFDNVGRNTDAIRMSYERYVDDVLNGNGKGAINLGNTPSSLVKSGIPDISMMITEKVVDKAHFDHGLTKQFLKNIPDLLASPLMVLKSDSQAGSFVVITNESQRDMPVMIAIKPNGEIENIKPVNIVASAYGRPATDIERWIKKGLLISSDKKAALAFATTNGLRLPIVIQSIRKSLALNIEENNTHVNGDIKFSRSGIPSATEINNTIRDTLTPNQGKQALGWLAGLFQRNHLIDFAAKDLPELNNYKLLSQQKDNFINQHEQYVAQAYQDMEKKLNKKVMHELGRVQGMATRLDDFDPATFDISVRDMNEQGRKSIE